MNHAALTRAGARTRPAASAVLLALTGCLGLALGVLVYLADREAGRALLIPSVDTLAGRHWFGTAGQWLPSFMHPFAFSLLSAALLPARARLRYGACVAWCLVDIVFELGQHPQLAAPLADALHRGLGENVPTRALVDYFQRGTFDRTDIAAALLGALAAAAVMRLVHPMMENDHAP